MPGAELHVHRGAADPGQLGRLPLAQQVGGARVALGEGLAQPQEERHVPGRQLARLVDQRGVEPPVGVVEVLALEQLHHGGVAVGGRHHDVGAELPAVAEPHTHRAVPLDQDLLDLGVVGDLAAETEVALLDRPGQRQRTALRHPGGVVGVRGELEVERQHREGRVLLVEDEVERLAQQRVAEPLREVRHQQRDRLADGVEVGGEGGQHPPALQPAHQPDRLEERIGRERPAEGADPGAELADRGGVGRREAEQVRLQPVRVGVEADRPAVPAPDDVEDVEVPHLLALERAQFEPDLVHLVARPVAEQPADAPVEREVAAVPAGAGAAGDLVHLEDPGAVAVHPGVAPGGQAAETAADDDHRLPPGCGVFLPCHFWPSSWSLPCLVVPGGARWRLGGPGRAARGGGHQAIGSACRPFTIEASFQRSSRSGTASRRPGSRVSTRSIATCSSSRARCAPMQ